MTQLASQIEVNLLHNIFLPSAKHHYLMNPFFLETNKVLTKKTHAATKMSECGKPGWETNFALATYSLFWYGTNKIKSAFWHLESSSRTCLHP
jgi:hypothetical protein